MQCALMGDWTNSDVTRRNTTHTSFTTLIYVTSYSIFILHILYFLQTTICVHNLFQNNIEPKILIAKSDWALTRCCWSFALEKAFLDTQTCYSWRKCFCVVLAYADLKSCDVTTGNNSSAIAEMAAQCCTRRISVVDWRYLPPFNVFFLNNIREYCHKSHIDKNYILWLTFLLQTVWVFNKCDVIGPKTTKLSEITQNNSH